MSPRICSEGTWQFSKTNSLVGDPLQPSFLWICPTENPGVPLLTMKAVIPPLAFFSGSVTAKTITVSAMGPLVTKCLRPLRTNPSFVGLAWVRMAETSAPASGSVTAKAIRQLPWMADLRYRFFWSSVPAKIILFGPWVHAIRSASLVAPNSSRTTHWASTPSPLPPYSMG